MEHSLHNLIKFSSDAAMGEEHEKISSFHYDHSGHVVATNSIVLFATKRPWEIEKAGRTFVKAEYEKGYFVESKLDFPEWKQAIPEECGRKITMKIPKWFEIFEEENRDATFVLDYSNVKKPFLKLSETVGETCLAFNAKYLSCFAGEEISFLITSPLSPTIVVNKESSLDPLSNYFREEVLREDWFYILMPIKLDEDNSSEVYM